MRPLAMEITALYQPRLIPSVWGMLMTVEWSGKVGGEILHFCGIFFFKHFVGRAKPKFTPNSIWLKLQDPPLEIIAFLTLTSVWGYLRPIVFVVQEIVEPSVKGSHVPDASGLLSMPLETLVCRVGNSNQQQNNRDRKEQLR